jgi:hypothetical protein
MPDIKQHPVLEFISDKIKTAIADAKLEKQSESISVIKDGNDTIHLEQQSDDSGNVTTILITDKKEILYSEDLLESLQDIADGTESNPTLNTALKSTSIVVNGLSIETDFIFQAVKDCFDTLSSSYQFGKIMEKKVNELQLYFLFGDNKFIINVINNPDSVDISGKYGSTINAKAKKTIEDDVVKVQQALNKLFKEN